MAKADLLARHASLARELAEVSDRLEREQREDQALATLPDSSMPDGMDSIQAAEYTGIPRSQIYALCRRGEIPHRQIGGKNGNLRFSRRALTLWLAGQEPSASDQESTDSTERPTLKVARGGRT